MKDRIPVKPNRYAVYDDDHNFIRYEYHERADEPTQVGDALNKANLLPDDVAVALGLDPANNPQIKDALLGGLRVEFVVTKAPYTSTEVLTALSASRGYLAAATDGNGNVLFGGGEGGSASTAVDKYTKAGVRSTLTPLSTARKDLAAATDGNGNVLFGGDYDRSPAVDKYTAAGVRSTLTSLSVGRGSLAAATDGNGNVLFGGG